MVKWSFLTVFAAIVFVNAMSLGFTKDTGASEYVIGCLRGTAHAIDELIAFRRVWVGMESPGCKPRSVSIDFSLTQIGALSDIKIKNSSGDKAFDEAAVKALKKGAPYAGYGLPERFFKFESVFTDSTVKTKFIPPT
jgi:hypothetical protein